MSKTRKWKIEFKWLDFEDTFNYPPYFSKQEIIERLKEILRGQDYQNLKIGRIK